MKKKMGCTCGDNGKCPYCKRKMMAAMARQMANPPEEPAGGKKFRPPFPPRKS